MSHVSNKRISKETARKIAEHLDKALKVLGRASNTAAFTDELLSETERVMIAKRLGIIVMLMRGESFASIKNQLGVTNQTVLRMYKALKAGKFKQLTKFIRRQDKQSDIFNLFGLLPHVAGTGRYDFLDEKI